MAFRRRLGNLADIFLKQHLLQQNADHESELVAQRQQEASKQAMAQRLLEKVTSDQRLAGDLAAKGMKSIAGLPMDVFTQGRGEALGAASKPVAEAKTLQDLPTIQDLSAGYSNQPYNRPMEPEENTTDPRTGLLKPKETDFMTLIAERQAKEASLKASASPVDRTYYDDKGLQQQTSVNPWDDQGKVYQKELTPEQTIAKDNQITTGEAPAKAGAAGKIAAAETAARMRAEWLDPKVMAAKLDFENKKRMGELAQIGARQEAMDLAKRSSAVKGLMPIYTQYKSLVNDVVNSPLGAGSDVTKGIQNTIGHLPVIGEFMSSLSETGHAMEAQVYQKFAGDPQLAKKIIQLNQLADTLAQGMANAVLGNRGQTTENDRRTAKSILVNSLTTASTARDMMAITDKMFSILPRIAAANPDAEPAVIIAQAASEAKATPDQPVANTGAPNTGAPAPPTAFKMTPDGQLVPR